MPIEAVVKFLERALATRGPGARTYAHFYDNCCREFRRYGYLQGFVPIFCRKLEKYQDAHNFSAKAGFVLNAMINNCFGNDITIVTSHLEKRLDYIGYQNNGKRIMVKGSLGASTAQEMKKGRIHVAGNVGLFAAELMGGGELIVEQDTGRWTGMRMLGGTIRVNGKIGEGYGSDMEGGRIYHKGKLVKKKSALLGKIRRLARNI